MLQSSLLLCRKLHTKGWQPGIGKMFLMVPNLHALGKEHNPPSAACLRDLCTHPAEHTTLQLNSNKPQEGEQIYHCFADVLAGGEEERAVRTAAQDLQNTLNGEGTEVPSAESPGSPEEVEFLEPGGSRPSCHSS